MPVVRTFTLRRQPSREEANGLLDGCQPLVQAGRVEVAADLLARADRPREHETLALVVFQVRLRAAASRGRSANRMAASRPKRRMGCRVTSVASFGVFSRSMPPSLARGSSTPPSGACSSASARRTGARSAPPTGRGGAACAGRGRSWYRILGLSPRTLRQDRRASRVRATRASSSHHAHYTQNSRQPQRSPRPLPGTADDPLPER